MLNRWHVLDAGDDGHTTVGDGSSPSSVAGPYDSTGERLSHAHQSREISVRERGNGPWNGGERGDRLRPANGADEVPPRRSTLTVKSYISPSDSRLTSQSAITSDRNAILYRDIGRVSRGLTPRYFTTVLWSRPLHESQNVQRLVVSTN